MDAQLLIWLVEHYSSPGETILDPMAGSGTTMLACMLGRNCVLVELEEKFCKMMRDNWNEVRMRPQLGYSMGDCQIIQGDARNLEGLLVDKCIFSPPFADQPAQSRTDAGILAHKEGCKCNFCRKNRGNKGMLQGYRQVDKIISSPPYIAQTSTSEQTEGLFKGRKLFQDGRDPQQHSEGQIGDLPYGNIDKCIFSPPYARDKGGEKGMLANDPKRRGDASLYRTYSSSENIDNLPYGEIDKIITSPPYEEGMGDKHFSPKADALRAEKSLSGDLYSNERHQEVQNIGNLKSQSYLQAMLQVYQQCYKVLKSQGLLILVTKNFIRNKKVIRLDEDTIKLCEQAGFSFLERHYRILPSQSFWRIIFHQKYPEVEQINHEDMLVFVKGNGSGFVDKVITSPPYAETVSQAGGELKGRFDGWLGRSCIEVRKYSKNPNNIGNLRYGDIKDILEK